MKQELNFHPREQNPEINSEEVVFFTFSEKKYVPVDV
jgi:hypothetical protein